MDPLQGDRPSVKKITEVCMVRSSQNSCRVLMGTRFDGLTGDVLDTIGEFLQGGERQLLQGFALVCKQTTLKLTSYKQECLNIQVEMLEE